MVDDTPSTPAGAEDLQPYDLVWLIPGNRLGIGPDVQLTVADTVDDAPGVIEVHHQTDHPDYMDWAAAVTVDDVATVVRITGTVARSWSPRP